MMYRTLRWIAGIALHWFYRDIRLTGEDRIPLREPLLIAVNHQNALVDSLIIGWIIPRRITMTAKATLTSNPLIAMVFRLLNVVPLRRASDEIQQPSRAAADRNTGAFREILGLLARNAAVLIFPEGKSHNETGLEPLKTGLARLALQSRDEPAIVGLKILPVGLVFEDKGSPGTLVAVHVGEAIDMDHWAGSSHVVLTNEIANRLRTVSEDVELPPSRDHTRPKQKITIRASCISISAWWGRITHEVPIRIARHLAVRYSRDADQPAMLTILVSLGLVLLMYAIHLAVVDLIVHSFWVDAVYLIGLLSGAYWAAFQPHHKTT